MRKLVIVLAFLIVFSGGLILKAHTPKNGLGDVAISPDGKTLVAGGDNRVLYVIDPSSLVVNKRIWFKTDIYEMEFNKDGSTLVVEDTSETLYFLNSKNWQIINQVNKAGYFSAAPAANLLAGVDSNYQNSKVKFLSMSDGIFKGQVDFPGKVFSIGIDADATRLVILANGPKDVEAKEKKPTNLKGLEADIFQQKNDGYVSIMAEYAIPSGKKLSEKTIFYYTGTVVTVVTKKATYFLAYNNINAKVEGDRITIFNCKSSFNYGMGVSPDRQFFLVGGLRDGTLTRVKDFSMTTFRIDRIPGWPEYFKGFGFAADGTGYAVTTAFRLVKINKNGGVEKTVPIY